MGISLYVSNKITQGHWVYVHLVLATVFGHVRIMMGNTRTTNKWEIAYIQENGSMEGNIKKKPTSPVVYCTITTWFGVICSFLNLNNFLLKVMFYILWSFVSWENKNLQKNVCIFFLFLACVFDTSPFT